MTRIWAEYGKGCRVNVGWNRFEQELKGKKRGFAVKEGLRKDRKEEVKDRSGLGWQGSGLKAERIVGRRLTGIGLGK